MPLMLPVLVKLQWTAKGPPGELPVIFILSSSLLPFPLFSNWCGSVGMDVDACIDVWDRRGACEGVRGWSGE